MNLYDQICQSYVSLALSKHRSLTITLLLLLRFSLWPRWRLLKLNFESLLIFLIQTSLMSLTCFARFVSNICYAIINQNFPIIKKLLSIKFIETLWNKKELLIFIIKAFAHRLYKLNLIIYVKFRKFRDLSLFHFYITKMNLLHNKQWRW